MNVTSARGLTLEQDFYVCPEIFAQDMELLLGRWICADHASEIPKPGDYRVVELGRESAILVRQEDGGIKALANVCRHRGSRICTKEAGRAAVLTCPYHAWTYRLDGRLHQAREMGADFNRALYRLQDLRAAVIGGLIFVSFGGDPPALEPAASALSVMTDSFGWASAKVAARRFYTVRANWKLVLENYHECYHCAPAHPEFSGLHALARPGNRRIGTADVESWAAAADGTEMVRVMHSALADGVQTGSRDGAALAPVMGEVAYGGGCVFAELGFLSAFLAYPDHGLIYRFIPREVLRTEMEVLWLVHGDAEPGRDYDPDALVWLWDVTSLADKAIIERNQDGVRSRFYRPGPYSPMEPGTRQFTERYVSERAARRGA